MAARTDSAILHEIVRIIRERAQVPEKVRIRTKQYAITYLEDHRQRLEEAMRRHDTDRIGMLFWQLPGRIKYQLLKAGRSAKSLGKPAARGTSKSAHKPTAKTASKPVPKPAAKPAAKSHPAPKSHAKAPAKPKPKPKTADRVAGKRRARA